FSKKEKIDAKNVITEAIEFWNSNNNKNYKKIIFIETTSTKVKDRKFGIKHQNKDWGKDNWKKLIDILCK